jgi:hypothetical protein
MSAIPITITPFPDGPEGTQGAEPITAPFVDLGPLYLAKPKVFPAAELVLQDGSATKYEKPATLKGFAPVSFKENYRNRANVIDASCVVVEFDGTATIDDVRAKLTDAGVTACIYTSFNHQHDGRDYFRAIVPASRKMTADEYDAAWSRMNALCGGGADDGAKDASRFWYGPAHVEGRPYVCELVEGAPLDVATLPAAAPSTPRERASMPTSEDPAVWIELASEFHDAAKTIGKAWATDLPSCGVRTDTAGTMATVLLRNGLAPEQVPAFVVAAANAAGFGTFEEKRKYAKKTVERLLGDPDAKVKGWSKLHDKCPTVTREIDRFFFLRSLAGVETAIVPANDTAPTPAPAPAGDGFAELLDWTGEIAPVEYLVQGVFERDTVNLLVAPPGGMKTWALYSFALAVASGTPWLGRFATKRTPVLLLDWETSKARAKRRLKILRKDGSPGAFYYKWQPGNAHDPKFWTALAKFVADKGIGLVVYDSLSGASGTEDENSTAFAAPLKAAAAMNVTHVWIHHAGKGDRKANEIARGSSAIQAAADTIYRFTEPQGSKATALECDMIVAKSGEGDQVERIGLRLTDRDGLTYREEAKHVPGERGDNLVARIRLTLAGGPVQGGARELASKLGETYRKVNEAVKVLSARGEVRGSRPLMLDTADAREKRIIAAITSDANMKTRRAVESAAEVDAEDVDRLQREGKIIHGGYGQSYSVAAAW